MNIVINGKCTKSCSFCFESADFKNNTKDMSMEDFEKIIDLSIESPDKIITINILGGEPSIHPNFLDMIDIMLKKESELPLERYFDLGIITNGDLLGTYIHKLYKFRYRVAFLLNASSMAWNKKELISKIDKLSKFQKTSNIDFGVSFTVTDFSILDDLKFLIERYKREELFHYRVAFASISSQSDFNYYIHNKKYVLEAYDYLNSQNREIGIDCSRIPTCAFTEEEFKKLQTYNIAKIKNDQNYLYASCINNADILPNGEIIHCMPLKEYNFKNKSYHEFNNIDDIYKYTYEIKIDAFRQKLKNATVCKDCPLYKANKCFAGCLGMNLIPEDEEIRKKFTWMSKL